MSRIYDPIAGKNLTASQIQNRINSPNLGVAYAEAGVTSVDEVKNYNPSANSSSSSSSSSNTTNNNNNNNSNNFNVNTTTSSSGLQVQAEYAQYVGQKEGRVVDGIAIPNWVDDDYLGSYVHSAKQGNPRKPNSREMTEMIAGVPIEQLYGTMDSSEWTKYTNQSSELLYSVVGSNQDTRDWNAITTAAIDPDTGSFNSDRFVAATRIATSQMYGGTTVQYKSGGYEVDEAGNTIIGADGNPVPVPPALFIVGNNGTNLRVINPSQPEIMKQTLINFGVQNIDWVGDVMNSMKQYGMDQVDLERNLKVFGDLQNSYTPWNNFQDIWGTEGLITGITPTIDSYKIITGQTLSGTATGTETTQVGTEGTQVTGDQTQQQTATDAVSMAANQAVTTPQQLPQTVSYQMPQGYQGSGFMPTYMNQTGMGMQTPTMTPMTGTFTKPAGTGMLSTQPSQTYTIGQTTTPTPQAPAQQSYDVRMYRNNTGMTTSITFVNGKPQTPIPSGFYPVDQQPAAQMPYQPQVPQVQAPIPQPVTPYTPQFNMNQGGIVPPIPTPSGNKFGGFKPEALQRIAQNLGYSGDMGGFDQYLNDNPDKKQKMDNYTTRARQMAEGGMVPKQAMIGGEPHRLAYVNPNEEKLLKAAGGAGVPSYGNIPAYFTIGPGSTVGQTVTDPTTNTVYTWNGSSWTTGDGYNVGTGMGTGTNTATASNPLVNFPNVLGNLNTNTTTQDTFAQQTSNAANNVTTAATTPPQSTTVSLGQYDPRVLNQQYIPQQPDLTGMNLTQVQEQMAKTPGLPTGATVVPTGTQLTAGQLVSPYSGQVGGSLALPTALAATEQSMMPMTGQAALMSPVEAAGAIGATVNQTQAAQLGQVAAITAAQQEGTSVSNVEAAQGTGILMNNPVQRKIETDPVTGESELISGVANAQTAAAFNEQIQAATATPTKQATVQGQLETLMAQFEGGNTPAWAAGSMRNAMATLSARGLGASSLAGQAVIQAAMESALPIAQMDAQVTAQFEQQNLSNRQQRAILAAQQRAQFLGQEFDQAFQARVANAAKISDIANMNFTAEQQVALENSRIANTMELNNLTNRQAMVMAEASALANLDMSNLNNRQQAAVQNAQNFLQADLTNLSNQQQTELFKAQQRVQSLFTDQAALNAAQQFNATSQNQVDQFFASLQSNTAQFNAAQANAQAQFNAGQVNTIERFNAEINNQRDQFNAQNRLIIDQSNAQWRREIATADTAAVNRANELNAQGLLGLSSSAYNNLWQFYADNMEWAWTSAENERARISQQAIAQLQADTQFDIAQFKADAESSSGFGNLIGKIFTADLSSSIGGSILGKAFGLG